MHEALIVFIVIGLPILCVTLIVVTVSKGKKHGKGATADDQQLIEEVYHGLKDLRRRIENLETIVDEQDNRRRQ